MLHGAGRNTRRPATSRTRRAAREVPDTQSARARLAGAEYVTVAEVAATLRVSKMTVYRLVRDGSLGSVRVGRSYRVVAGSVLAYLDKNSHRGDA